MLILLHYYDALSSPAFTNFSFVQRFPFQFDLGVAGCHLRSRARRSHRTNTTEKFQFCLIPPCGVADLNPRTEQWCLFYLGMKGTARILFDLLVFELLILIILAAVKWSFVSF